MVWYVPYNTTSSCTQLLDCPIDMTQHKKTQNGIIYIFFIFWKKNFWKNFQNFFFFWNFLKLFGKNFWTIFEEKKFFFLKIFLCLFVLCRVVSFTRHMCWVVSYRYDTTHLDSLLGSRNLKAKLWKIYIHSQIFQNYEGLFFYSINTL